MDLSIASFWRNVLAELANGHLPEQELEVLGGPWEVPGGTKNGGGSLGASWDGPGGALGCFWRYGAILGSVLRCQKVAISLVLEGFLICHVF